MAELSGRVKQPMPRCLGQAGRSGPLQGRRNKMVSRGHSGEQGARCYGGLAVGLVEHVGLGELFG